MRFQQVAIFHEKSRETNKMRFQKVAFPWEKAGKPKKLYKVSTSMVYKKSFLNIPLFLTFFGYQVWTLYKMLWFLDVDIRAL